MRDPRFLPFEEAREFARGLGIEGQKEWVQFVKTKKRPIGIPTHPEKAYGRNGEWTNWYDWLGKTRGKSGEGAATRRIVSRFEELEKLGFSVDEIMSKLEDEFPEKSLGEIKRVLRKAGHKLQGYP